MTEPKAIDLGDYKLNDSRFTYRDGSGWYANRLVEYAKDLEPFDLPLRHIDIGIMPFGIDNVLQFASHMQRVNNTDLKYPVIMDCGGYILDGWHRIAKALVEGRATIKAVRFENNPPYDFLGDN